MPGINRIPYGLLGLTGLQSLGENPDTLARVVQPNVDITRLWLASQTDYRRGTATVAGIGFLDPTAGDSFTVPDRKIWFVTGYTVRSTCGGLDSIFYIPCVRGPPSDGAFLAADNVYQGAGANQEVLAALFAPGNWVAIPAGWRMGIHIKSFSGAPAMFYNARIVEVDG